MTTAVLSRKALRPSLHMPLPLYAMLCLGMRTLAHPRDAALIYERLSRIQIDDRALWGLMTAHEMVCHLRAAVRMAAGEVQVAPVRLPVPRAVVKAVALRLPLPWRKNFETVAELKRGTAAMQPTTFAADHRDMLAELRRFCTPEQARVDHPFFGPMSPLDWMRWAYVHTDHHLRQFGH